MAGFARNAPSNVHLLETMVGFWPRMPTPSVTIMTLGGGTIAAYALQIASGIAAAAITALIWRSQASMRVKGRVPDRGNLSRHPLSLGL